MAEGSNRRHSAPTWANTALNSEKLWHRFRLGSMYIPVEVEVVNTGTPRDTSAPATDHLLHDESGGRTGKVHRWGIQGPSELGGDFQRAVPMPQTAAPARPVSPGKRAHHTALRAAGPLLDAAVLNTRNSYMNGMPVQFPASNRATSSRMHDELLGPPPRRSPSQLCLAGAPLLPLDPELPAAVRQGSPGRPPFCVEAAPGRPRSLSGPSTTSSNLAHAARAVPTWSTLNPRGVDEPPSAIVVGPRHLCMDEAHCLRSAETVLCSAPEEPSTVVPPRRQVKRSAVALRPQSPHAPLTTPSTLGGPLPTADDVIGGLRSSCADSLARVACNAEMNPGIVWQLRRGSAAERPSHSVSSASSGGPAVPQSRPERPSRGRGGAYPPEASEGPGAWALSTIDARLADQICDARDLSELEEIRRPFADELGGSHPEHLGTWMVWMVHRVALNDPGLTRLDFSTYGMPMGEEEDRIVTKLMEAIGSNTHLEELQLSDSNLHGGQDAEALASSLRRNRTLRRLNLECNFLEPEDLRQIFGALLENTSVEELKCSSQFCDQPTWDTYQCLAEALKKNRTLRKLGMELTDAHWRDQINRGLVRNVEITRKQRYALQLGGTEPNVDSLQQQQYNPDTGQKHVQVSSDLGDFSVAVGFHMADAGGA